MTSTQGREPEGERQQPGGRGYRVKHRTEYVYDEEVTASYGRAHLTPRDEPGQWTVERGIEVSPIPELLTESEDFFGNTSVYVEVQRPHTRLVVTATSVVQVHRPVADLSALVCSWEQARDAVLDAGPKPAPNLGRTAAPGPGPRPGPGPGPGPTGLEEGIVDVVQARGFLLPSPQVPASGPVGRYAGRVFRPGRAVGEAVRDLITTVHADVRYAPGVTTVSTPLDDVLERREGVCQDFAHLTVACLRSVGLPARYVSGYLETRPPPGRPRLEGADASHAWVSVLLPELGWVDLDPTNDQLVDDDYVVTAWGRDYSDVPPLKGVIFSEGSRSTMTVAVDVLRI